MKIQLRLLPAILYFTLMISAAHGFAPPGYSWLKHTISDLGAQGHAYKGIMQAGFIGFGLLLTGGLALKFRSLGRINLPDVLIMVYGLSVLLTGVFCTQPLDSSLAYSATEAQRHSFFATAAGVALSAAILWYGLSAPNLSQRLLHLIFLLLIVGISLMFGLAENGSLAIGKGLVQRGLYLTAFIWLSVNPTANSDSPQGNM